MEERFLMVQFKHLKTGFMTYLVIKPGQNMPDLEGYKLIKVSDYQEKKPELESDK